MNVFTDEFVFHVFFAHTIQYHRGCAPVLADVLKIKDYGVFR